LKIVGLLNPNGFPGISCQILVKIDDTANTANNTMIWWIRYFKLL